MTQVERDRLVTLKKAKRRLLTERKAAEELNLSVRQVKRLLYGLKKHGDKAVVHGLRGKPSKRKIQERENRTGGCSDLVGACISGIRSDVGGGVFGEEPRHRGEQGNGPTVDDPEQAMAGERIEDSRGASLAALAEPVWGAGAMGHQRTRLAGGGWRAAVRGSGAKARFALYREMLRTTRLVSRLDWFVEGAFATIPSSHSIPLLYRNYQAPNMRFPGMAESIWSDGVQKSKSKSKPEPGPSARWSAPDPGNGTRREQCAPFHGPQVSSGRLFVDRVARHCLSPLHQHADTTTHLEPPGKKGTFPLCVDITGER